MSPLSWQAGAGMSTVIASSRDSFVPIRRCGIGVRAGQQEQRPALGAAQHAGDRRALAHVDAVGHGAALDDPLELMGQGHRRPDSTVGVECDAVGRPVETLGEDPAIGQ